LATTLGTLIVTSIFDIATHISTPLMLAGFLAAAFFLIARQLLAKNFFSKLTADSSAGIIKQVISALFVLSLVAMVLGFVGYVWAPKNEESISCETRSSTNATDAATITFRNRTDHNVSIDWINYDGALKHYFDVGPKGEESTDTFISHSWCVTDATDGRVLKAITVTSADEDVSIY
jgi:predicted PurR-regulated permease PerM